MFIEKCREYISNNPDNIDGFIDLLVDEPLQTRKVYKEIYFLLPNQEYKDKFAYIILKNSDKIIKLENQLKIDRYQREIDKDFNDAKILINDKKLVNKLAKKKDSICLQLKYGINDFSVLKCETLLKKYRKYINKICRTNTLRQNKKFRLIFGLTTSFVSCLVMFLLIANIPVVQYQNMGKYAEVTGIKGLIFESRLTVNTLRIKEEYDGVPVRTIAKDAFVGCEFKEIVLPNKLYYIGNNAFQDCDNLTGIHTYIDDKLHKDTINCNQIGSASFAECSSLKKLYVTENVEKITFNAFTGTNLLIYYHGSDKQWAEKIGQLYDCNVDFLMATVTLKPKNIGYNLNDVEIVVYKGTKISEIGLENVEITGYTITSIVDGLVNDIMDSTGQFYEKYEINEDIYLYYEAKSNKYKVTLSGENAYLYLYYGDSYILDYLEKSGYTFVGYFTEKNGNGVQLTDENGSSIGVWNIDSDCVIYPHYIKNQ